MNVIQIPSDHKMFNEEFSGSLENFIYDEFVLTFMKDDKIDLGLTVFLEINEGDISGTQIHLVKLFDEWIDNVYYDVDVSETSKVGYEVFCNKGDYRYINIGYDIVSIVIRTILYIMNTPRERTERPKNTKISNTQKAESKVNIENKIYLLDEIVDYVNENGLTVAKSGNHTITCPCWSVRGHYRRYKNGNVVFVKSYEKGKEKGKTKPKDKVYTI